MAGMFYSLKETAERLGKTEDEVKQLATDGRLREFRDGSNLLFKIDEVNALVAEGLDTEAAAEPEMDLDLSLEPEEAGAEAAHQFQRGGDVAQVRHIAHRKRFRAQQGRCQYRQGGILGPGDADFTAQGAIADNIEFIHDAQSAAAVLSGCRAAKASMMRSICSLLCAALTLQRSRLSLVGEAGGITKLT